MEEYDGLLEDLDLLSLATNGAIALEYMLRKQHLDETGMLKPEIRKMLGGVTNLFGPLIAGLSIYERIPPGGKMTPAQQEDWNRGSRFDGGMMTAIQEGFGRQAWLESVRVYQRVLRQALLGEGLSDSELKNMREFLNDIAAGLIQSVEQQQAEFANYRGIHQI